MNFQVKINKFNQKCRTIQWMLNNIKEIQIKFYKTMVIPKYAQCSEMCTLAKKRSKSDKMRL